MARIDTTAKLVAFDGTEVRDGKGPMTLGMCCIGALMSDPQGKATGEEKWKRYALATRIHQSQGVMEIDAADLELIRNLVGAAYQPIAVGPAWTLLA